VIEAEVNATLNRASAVAEARARELKATGTTSAASRVIALGFANGDR
jgi:hypothetical protein